MSAYDIDRGSSGLIKDYDSSLDMNKEVKLGQVVRVKHYSVSEYDVTEITGISQNSVKIRITNKLIRSNVFQGDNITVIFISDNNEECLVDGIVENIQPDFPQYFLIRCIRIRRFRDFRKSRRYEVDVCCNALDEEASNFGNIKNISFSGSRLITKAMIEDRKNFKLELFFGEGKKTILDVGVVRSKKHMNYYEYGLVILGMDDTSKQIIGEVINTIMKQEKQLV